MGSTVLIVTGAFIWELFIIDLWRLLKQVPSDVDPAPKSSRGKKTCL